MGTWSTHSSAVVIDRSIAIVVEHVAANFGHGLRLLRAGKSPRHAREHAFGAHAGQSRRARITAAGIAVIDGTIAIVIQVIAHLGHGAVCLDTQRFSFLAIDGADTAHADEAGTARVSDNRHLVVDEAVAIVVQTIT